LAGRFTLRTRSIGFTTGSREAGEPKSLNKNAEQPQLSKPAEEREGWDIARPTTRMKADRFCDSV
jgi:hypothetical protein